MHAQCAIVVGDKDAGLLTIRNQLRVLPLEEIEQHAGIMGNGAQKVARDRLVVEPTVSQVVDWIRVVLSEEVGVRPACYDIVERAIGRDMIGMRGSGVVWLHASLERRACGSWNRVSEQVREQAAAGTDTTPVAARWPAPTLLKPNMEAISSAIGTKRAGPNVQACTPIRQPHGWQMRVNGLRVPHDALALSPLILAQQSHKRHQDGLTPRSGDGIVSTQQKAGGPRHEGRLLAGRGAFDQCLAAWGRRPFGTCCPTVTRLRACYGIGVIRNVYGMSLYVLCTSSVAMSTFTMLVVL